MRPDVDFFEKLRKDNRAQEISKNLTSHPSLQEEFVNFSMNCQICFNYLTQEDAHRLWKEKRNMDKGEKGNHGVLLWEKVSFGWARRLPVLLAWSRKGEAVVFKKAIWRRRRRIYYGLGIFYFVWKSWEMGEKQNSARYIIVLEKSLFPFLNHLDTNNPIFQQDNAAIHTSKLTKNWFKTKNIGVLDWPTKSPDLNPIENSWGILSRRVYKNKRQFENRETLKSCIEQYWNEIPSETLRKLIESMQNRCFKVIQRKGNKCRHWILLNFAVKYKFSKLSYTYFHPQKRIFLNNFLNKFFGVKSCYKIKYVY